MKHLFFFLLICLSISCSLSDEKAKRPVYVKPTITRTGQIRKGYVRKPVSTSKHAYKQQAKSRYYYQTRGKYRRKK